MDVKSHVLAVYPRDIVFQGSKALIPALKAHLFALLVLKLKTMQQQCRFTRLFLGKEGFHSMKVIQVAFSKELNWHKVPWDP